MTARIPLPPIAREARTKDQIQARWLVQVCRKNGSKTDLAGLCRDRRVSVRYAAAAALISLLVSEATADKEALKAWHDAVRARRGGAIGTEDVPDSFAPQYGRDRDTFIRLLEAEGVPGAAFMWRQRHNLYKNAVLNAAIEAADPERASFLRLATAPTSTPTTQA